MMGRGTHHARHVATFLLALAAALGIASCGAFYWMPQDEGLPDTIKERMQGADTLDLASVADFEWDTVYVIGQYASVKELLENDGVRYVNLSNPMNDGYLLVFCLDNEIVSYCNIYSNIVDYSMHSAKRSYENSVVAVKDGKIMPDGWENIYLPENESESP